MNRSKTNRRRVVVSTLLLVPLLYVLSIGPVAKWDCDHGPVAGLIYAPLGALTKLPVANDFLRWYIFRLWKADTMGDNTF